MADSTLTQLIGDYRRGGRSAQAAAISVEGAMEVTELLRTFGAMQVYVTSFTSRKVAHSVFMSALRHAPEDEADLINSGFVDSVEGRQDSLYFTVNIAENLEGTPDYAAIEPNFQTSFSQMDYFGTRMRTFTKYVVGFDAPHAAVVHENPRGVRFRQPSEGTRTHGTQMKFPDEKTDHYLLNAFNQHRDKFSAAMHHNTRKLLQEFQRNKFIGRTPAPKAIGGKLGAPRLVKR